MKSDKRFKNTRYEMWQTVKWGKRWNVTKENKTNIYIKIDKRWNLPNINCKGEGKSSMECVKRWKGTQFGMWQKMKCDQRWSVKKDEMWQKLRCEKRKYDQDEIWQRYFIWSIVQILILYYSVPGPWPWFLVR